jgi:hypothetical protein
MAIMAGLFLILPMAFKSSAPKEQESISNEIEKADENAEIKAIEEETEENTEEPSKENKGE